MLLNAMAEDHLGLDVRNGAYPGERIIALDGVLNLNTAMQFRDCVRDNATGTTVLDMSHVRYVDSTGLGTLIGTYVSFERQYRRLLLAGLNDRIWDLFRMCRIDDVFTRYPSVEDAERTVPDAGSEMSAAGSAEAPTKTS